MEDAESVVQTVEIIKRPGQSLGFYIREGNGRDRWDGVFISRLAAGSVAEQNGLLKIGDEILSVNGAVVNRKRLEDVVISMSIPKRLVLVVRRNPNAAAQLGDSASLGSSGGQSGIDEEQPPPVVVVKCPRPAQSYPSSSLGHQMMMTLPGGHMSKSPGSDQYQYQDFYIGDQQRFAYSSSPAGMQKRTDDYWGSLGKMGNSGGALMIQTQQQGFMGGDDSGDSGLSSDNSGFFRQIDSSSGPSASTSLSKTGSGQSKEEPQPSGTQVISFRHDDDFGDDIMTSGSAVSPNQLLQTQQFHQQLQLQQQQKQQQQQQQISCRPSSFSTTSANTLSSCRAPSIERSSTGYSRTNPLAPGYQHRSCSARPDYSSDSDTYTFDHAASRQKLRAYPTNPASDFYPENPPTSLDWPSHYNPRWHFSPGEYATLDRRFSYSTAAEQQLSQKQKWEALDSATVAWNQRIRERQTREGRYVAQIGGGGNEKIIPGCFNQEVQPGGASSSLNSLLRQFDTFSLEQNKSPYLSDDLTSLYSSGGGGVSSDKETYTLGRQMSLNYPYAVIGGKSPSSSQIDVNRMNTASTSNSRRRVTRKLSSTGDCEYAEVVEEESSSPHPMQINLAAARLATSGAGVALQPPQLGTVSGSSSSSSTSSHQSRTLTRNPSMSSTAQSVGESAPKNLIKTPLHIRKEAFKTYQSILPQQQSKSDLEEPAQPLDGCLVCHVFCGHGLVSNRAVLQDLYCVVELDSLGCARTTVHTGAMNFDWDDRFEMDLNSARYLSFSVYSYDPSQGARHRLVYGGSVHLAALFHKATQQNSQQQQHNRLALQLQPRGTLYIELLYQTIEILYRRTPSLHLNSLFGTELATVVEREKSGRNIPMLLVRCVEEIEKRGLDQVGIYRLCGSARRKQQLREELEKNPMHIDLSPSVVGDINVVTVILKDFVRELPEPLCPSSLYEALAQESTRESTNNAQLMMTIMECCPKINQDTLFFLLDHLLKVGQRSTSNKMTPRNLSIIFGPLFFYSSSSSSSPSSSSSSSSSSGAAAANNGGKTTNKHAEMLKLLMDVCSVE